MGTFLKVFFAMILVGLGLYVVFGSPFAAVFGGLGPFIIQVIIGIALIAGGITLLIKVRR
jgi:hypothetical protein